MTLYAGVRPEKIRKIENKFFQQLIIGKSKKNQDEEDNDHVENNQHLKKDKASEVTDYQRVSDQLAQTIIKTIEHHLAEPKVIMPDVGITDIQVKLMDILQVDSLDLNRVSKQVELLPWLEEELGILVNGLGFRHRRPNESDVKVTDLRLVLSYIGLETLKTLIPYYCARKWLPKEQSYIVNIKRTLWHYTSITAISANVLAKKNNKDSVFCYICGLLYQLGLSAILSSSSRVFDEVRQYWLKSSKHYEDEYSDIYDAVVDSEFPSKFIYDYVLKHASLLNWQLLEMVHFENSNIAKVLKELYSISNVGELSEESLIISKASCFAKVFLLEKKHKITAYDRELICNYYQITDDVYSELRALDFNTFDLL